MHVSRQVGGCWSASANGSATPDGWRYRAGAIRVEPFEPLDAATGRELDEEGERLAAFHR